MKKKKRRLSNGTIFINLLPYMALLGASGFVLCKTCGVDVVESFNQWKIQNEYINDDDKFIDLPDMPTWDDVKDFFGVDEQPEDTASQEVTSGFDGLPIEVTPIEEAQEQEVEEEEIIEEEPEPVIYPEYTSSELLDSGYEFLDIDFDGLKAQNPDVVGWIQVPGTKINYPVVQGSGPDNDDPDYYLHHDLNGNTSSYGAIYIDPCIDLGLGDNSSTVQISPIGIYGHHMKANRSEWMFRELCNYYQVAGYLDTHPYAIYYNEDGAYKLTFFADTKLVKKEGEDTVSNEGVFTNQLFDESSYVDFVNGILNNSTLNTDIVPTYGDKIGYLSTCAYSSDCERYVLWYKAEKQYTNEIDKENSVEVAKTLTLN